MKRILARDSNNGAALGHSSIALSVLGQKERAKEWMERTLLVDPDNLTMRSNFVCRSQPNTSTTRMRLWRCSKGGRSDTDGHWHDSSRQGRS